MLDRFKLLLMSVLPLPLLCACGSSAHHFFGASPSGSAQHQANSKANLKASRPEEVDMVAAVSQSGADTTIGVKFRLAARPVVGTPVQIVLSLVPGTDAGITHIHGSLQPGEGLVLQSQRTFDITAPQDGVALTQDVTVLPQQDGVLSLSAILLIDFDNGSLARTYSIPIIAMDHAS
jgi:hypothetical protein